MSNYPAWAIRDRLEHKYKDKLTSPYTDQQDLANLHKAIEETVRDKVREQEAYNRQRVNAYKKDMR